MAHQFQAPGGSLGLGRLAPINPQTCESPDWRLGTDRASLGGSQSVTDPAPRVQRAALYLRSVSGQSSVSGRQPGFAQLRFAAAPRPGSLAWGFFSCLSRSQLRDFGSAKPVCRPRGVAPGASALSKRAAALLRASGALCRAGRGFDV